MMGWAVGFDSQWGRDIGYGVPATCDRPGCGEVIDRGLSYVCGGEPYGGEHGCGLYFCGEHLVGRGQRCERCEAGEPPFEPTPDTAKWLRWKLTDDSWEGWRVEHPAEVALAEAALATADELSPDAAGPGPQPGAQLRVRCLLLIGDQAELVVEDGDPDDVVQHPAAEVAAEAGIPVADLPGKVLLVTIAGEDGGRPVLAGFRLAG